LRNLAEKLPPLPVAVKALSVSVEERFKNVEIIFDVKKSLYTP
jgi:hypothetical protein